jgi:hypothetical protein
MVEVDKGMALSPESIRIADELARAFDGDSWHGSPLLEVLKDVTAPQAAAKHPQLAHSIWGLVAHLTAWIEVVTLRLTERRPIHTPLAGDFPAVVETSVDAWKKTLDELKRQHLNLLNALAALRPEQFDEIVPGMNYPVAVMLHGTSQHYAYHAGQIALLKKLLSSV